MKRTIPIIQAVILILTIIASVLGFFLLPERVAVQWNAGGVSNTLPRLAAVLIPVGITLVCILSWNRSAAQNPYPVKLHTFLWSAASCIGILLNIVFIVMN